MYERFKSRLKIEDHKYIYNNKFIIKINQDFEHEKKTLRSL